MLYTKDEKFSSQAAFDNVALVLRPVTPQTLADICGIKRVRCKYFRALDSLVEEQLLTQGRTEDQRA